MLICVDIAGFALSTYASTALVTHNGTLAAFRAVLLGPAMVFIPLWIVMFERLGLYRRSFALSVRDEFYYTTVALLVGIVPQLVLFTIVPQLSTSRLALIVAAATAIVIVGSGRAIVHRFHGVAQLSRRRSILVIGPATALERSREGASESGIRYAFYAVDAAMLSETSSRAVLERMRWFQEARRRTCDSIILTSLAGPEAIDHLVSLAERFRIRVEFGLDYLRALQMDWRLAREPGRIVLRPIPLAISRRSGRVTKRVIDIAISALALVLVAPIMIVAAAAIFIEDGAPIFFTQQRVGRGGKPFRIVKFRTMRRDADARWAVEGDRRITRLGAFLRRTSIDELPQLFNVMRGEMSIVGPRPEMTEYARTFARHIRRYDERHRAKPGITGWSQINLKRNLTPDDMVDVLRYDLFYVENWSPYLDLAIVFKTAVEFLFHRAV